jgi:DNA polymerase-1
MAKSSCSKAGSTQKSLPGWEPEATPPPSMPLPPIPANRPAAPPPDSLEGLTVWVVDANSLIHQVFHALPEMTSPRGEPVGAVFGFTRDLFFLLETKKPDFLFCAFDLPGKTFRHELFDQYKAGRPMIHEDLAPQMPLVRRVLDAFGLPALGCPNYEADDILATVARITEERGGQCFLVTGDKDARQLITDRVKVYNIRKDLVYDRDALAQEWGVRPDQVVDFQALVGDSTDNVPGVPQIGPKAAQDLLRQYETLDAVLAHAAEVTGAKRRENLQTYGEQAMLSRQLVRLDTHVPVEIDWQGARVGGFDRQGIRNVLADFGFRALAARADTLPGKAGPVQPAVKFRYHVVDTPAAFSTFLEQLRQQKWFALDTETTHINPRWADLVGLTFAWQGDEGWYLPLRAPEGERRLDERETLERLRPILEDPGVAKIGQNLKYDIVALRGAGVRVAGVSFDSMVASYLLDAGQRNHNLDDLAKRYLGHETIKISSLIGTGRDQKRMDEVSVQQVAEYSVEDAILPVRLRPLLELRLAEAGLDRLFRDLELPLIDVLVELEFNGVRIDQQRLAELSKRYGQRMVELEEQIYAIAGRPFNLGSPKQLQEILFTEFRLPITKKTKTGASTDVEVLEELAAIHPLPAKIIEYRQYAKLKSTYVDALPTLVCPKTGRVHTSFKQDVTATGRLSSSDPNLQNIPVRTEEGREIRSAFIPGEPGWVLLAADYSQIELRVLAHFSQDPHLCEAFARDEDIHARVASQVHGVPLKDVTESMRRQAKAVNFGVIYGQSPYGLARQLGIDQHEAARFINNYFEGYAGIEKFLATVLAECRERGYVSTILGRRRAIEGVRESAGRQRNLAERTAINSVIQGSAADLIKQAMIAVERRLRREASPARMLLQIHDELVFEVPSEQLNDLATLVREEMVGAGALRVPLKVDLKAGPNWADAKPWH